MSFFIWKFLSAIGLHSPTKVNVYFYLYELKKTFANYKISIKNLIQNPYKKNKKASIIIITHENLEKNYKNLLKNLIKNKFVLKKPTFIRIEKI